MSPIVEIQMEDRQTDIVYVRFLDDREEWKILENVSEGENGEYPAK